MVETNDADWHVCARILLTIRHPTKPELGICKQTQHRFNQSESDWGYSTLITPWALLRGDASMNKEPLLDNGRLVLALRVQVIKDATGMLWHNFVDYDSKKMTGYVGLLNQGATCYMNSLLQSLFLTPALRRATFQIPTDQSGLKPTESIALALQRTFYRLQTSTHPVGTTELTCSFGWDTVDSFMQHDVHEFSRVLLDELETRMKKTEVEGTIEKLFTGKLRNVKQCMNVPFESVREEAFYDLQLTVRGQRSLEDSFKSYLASTELTGDNQYRTEEHGYQDARMFTELAQLPPLLHLHLERYTYDMMTGNTVKINDRFEFPPRIDLAPYVKATEGPMWYRLHSVLVHGGDSHGGHYYVYIRPGAGDDAPWYKFDDTKVVPVMEREAVEENYGQDPDGPPLGLGEEPGIGRINLRGTAGRIRRRITNAYMLVYVRESDWDAVMTPVSDEEVPAYIGAGVQADAEEEARHRAEKHELMNALHVSLFNDQLLRSYAGVDVINVLNRAQPLSNYESLRMRKSDTVGHLLTVAAQEMSVDPDSLRLWTFASRRNYTYRLDAPVSDYEKSLGALSQATRFPGQLNVYIEHTGESHSLLNMEEIGSTRFIGFKYYANGTLVCLGYRHVPAEMPVGETVSRLLESCGLGNDVGALEIFEEIKPSRVERVDPEHSFELAKLGTGDLLVIAPVDLLASGETCLQYYHSVVSRVLINIVPFPAADERRKRSSEDLPEEPARETGFQLAFGLDEPIDQLLTSIAEHWNMDTAFLRLHIQDSRSERLRLLEAPPHGGTLLDALKLSSEPSASEYTIAAERLSVPLARLSTLKRLNLWLPDFEDSVEIFIEPDATVNELVDSLPDAIKAQLNGTQRLLEILSHRIHRDFEGEFMLTLLPRDANVFLVPEPEVTPEDKIISVQWYYRDPTRGYGLPFLFVLHQGETWQQTKSRLIKSLGSRLLPSAVMHWISFGQVRPIGDQEDLHAIAQCTRGSQRVEGGFALGIDQSPSSRAPAPTFAPERSIRIRK